MKTTITFLAVIAFGAVAYSQIAPVDGTEFGYDAKINEVIARVNTNEEDIAAIPAVLDEDDFASDSATQPPSQQSVEARIDTKLAEVDSVNLEQDSATLTADNIATGIIYTGEDAGETIAQWLAVSYDTTAGEFLLCQPDTFAEMDYEGLAYAASTNGNPISLVNDGYVRNDAWAWTAGDDIYVIANGVLTATKPTTAGDFYVRIARAISADEIKFYKTQVVLEVPTP
jgi:hypothetical protein